MLGQQNRTGSLSGLGHAVFPWLFGIRETRSGSSVLIFPHPNREPSTHFFGWEGGSFTNLRMKGSPPKGPICPAIPTSIKVLLVSSQYLLPGQVQRQLQGWSVQSLLASLGILCFSWTMSMCWMTLGRPCFVEGACPPTALP